MRIIVKRKSPKGSTSGKDHDRDYLVRGSEQHLPPRCPRADTCREKTAPCPRNLSTVSIIGRGIASPTVVLRRLDEVHLPVLEPHSLKYGVWKSKLQGLGVVYMRAPEPTNIPEGRNLCDKKVKSPVLNWKSSLTSSVPYSGSEINYAWAMLNFMAF
ncbi:hypothetical protein CEXT_615981 [Caerostris extrusa]|uniref:Uncharacterized protein n=1 Tax=Caerostris extrusa TaxID=172846 RepID=A0AAV4SQV1_CAEEX|nr:hypothetical protein CEXT_615981 [Caerostris extrusa]